MPYLYQKWVEVSVYSISIVYNFYQFIIIILSLYNYVAHIIYHLEKMIGWDMVWTGVYLHTVWHSAAAWYSCSGWDQNPAKPKQIYTDWTREKKWRSYTVQYSINHIWYPVLPFLHVFSKPIKSALNLSLLRSEASNRPSRTCEKLKVVHTTTSSRGKWWEGPLSKSV